MAVTIFRRRYKDRSGQERQTRTWYFYPPGSSRAMSTGLRDQRLAKAKAAKLYADGELIRSGLLPASEIRARLTPLKDLLLRYRIELEVRGRDDRYIQTVRRQLDALLDRATQLSQVDRDYVLKALSRVKSGRSEQTLRAYQGALRSFFTWLVDQGEWTSNPVPRNTQRQTDATRERRALTEDQVAKLLKVCRSEHRLAYTLAVRTGLRRGELGGLTWRDLDLRRKLLTVRASVSKNSKRDQLPLHEQAVKALKTAPQVGPSATPVFHARRRGRQPEDTAGLPVVPSVRLMRKDLEAARIPYEDEDGLVADFHALRHSFITLLVQAGAPLAMVQKLARHSTPHLTARFYTHLRAEDLRGALDLMAKPKRTRAKKARRRA